MIGSHKWQGGQCEKLSRWVPKAPSMLPPDGGAHKLAGISGVQPASDLSLLFTGGKGKILPHCVVQTEYLLISFNSVLKRLSSEQILVW